MSIKIGIAGCKSTSKFIAEFLNELNCTISLIITINPEQGFINKVADYYDMKLYGETMGILVYQAKSYSLKNPEDEEFIKKMKLDILFVMGWQRLIPEWFLKSLKIGAFGMHGSSEGLPKGRGRSPMNWSIIEGRKEFTTCLFKYDAGVDSGDIVDSYKFTINEFDTGETCHYKNSMAMKYLIRKNLDKLLKGEITLIKQPKLIPTFYPKRTPLDSLIDWEMNLNDLHRFIRAVTKPFNGAFTFNNGEKIIIWRAEKYDDNFFGYDSYSNGMVVEKFQSGKFIVKVKNGLLIVHEYEGEIFVGSILNNNNFKISVFKKNENGFYDLPEDEIK